MPLIRQLSKYLMILPCGILLAVEWEPLMYPRGFKALLRIGEKTCICILLLHFQTLRETGSCHPLVRQF